MHGDLPSDISTFGDLLRHHRRARVLSQDALAERAGISVRTISDLERGLRTHPYRETARLLAEALGLGESERAAWSAAATRPRRLVARAEPAAQTTRLPSSLTRLIGRDAERREITGLLRDERIRLLTLTGPAGVGKTRLAVTVAAGVGTAFRDGIVFVDLAPLGEPSLVVGAIAAALDLTDQGAIPLIEAVRRRLSTRQLLLVLDNFEHLLSAAPQVSDLLQSAPEVQVLVTSRAVLRLHGERDYPVAPLRTPAPGTSVSSGALGEWEAIQLFVERAREVQPGFRLTDENASPIVAVCQRLDGLPLAIELAAAWGRLLTPAIVLDRLGRALPLLTGGQRDAPERQRTLQAAIAWSYDLLHPSEQALLRCLSVFVGGWTLEAAETVGSLIGVPDVLHALAALVEQNLVVRDDGRELPRFRLLETIREFALEQLQTADQEERARRAHLQYLLQLARENDLERLDAEVGTRLVRLQAEEANLRAGIAWALEHDPETALVVLAELDYFWYFVDRPAGRDLHERVLKTDAATNHPARARVLQQAAWLAILTGDYTQAELLAEAARVLAAQLGDAQTMTRAQMCQGELAVSRDDVVRATALLSDALAQCDAHDDLWGTMMCLTGLGQAVLGWGDAAASARYFERLGAIVVAQDLPARYHLHYLDNLAYAYHDLGRHEDAMEAGGDARRHANDVGGAHAMAVQRTTLARLLLDAGETAQAVTLSADIGQGLGFFWEIGDRWNLAPTLELAAAVLVAGGQAEPAGRFLGAAAALRIALPRSVGVSERATLANERDAVIVALGEAAFTQAWTAGQAQPLEKTVAEALAALAR